MPSTPTTKSQVQAYRFVLRRMQSALVRKDAVMLHDPMRTHTRATIVGVCIAAVGVVGFLVWGLLSPDPKPPDQDSIVISKQSGEVYVLIANPKQLIPTFNLASARLLLVARQQQNQPPGAPAAPAGGGPVEPTIVDEKELKDIPRGRKTGIQNGPDLLPGEDSRIGNDWAVCDKYILDPSLPNPASENKVETTVLAGVPTRELGDELAESTALLVQAENNKVYLVYRTPVNANIKNANAVRAEVDMTNASVRAALNLEEADVRRISTGTLNAIPEAPALRLPAISGRGDTPDVDVEGLKVGEVFKVARAGEGFDYYVMQKGGIELIKQATADLIRFTKSATNGEQIVDVRAASITGVLPVEAIDDTDSPEVQPEILEVTSFPVACLGWTVVNEGPNAEHHTELHVSDRVPHESEDVAISTPGPDGQRIDHFYMPPGRAAVVRASRSKEDFGTGPIYLISDRGVKYGVPDRATADVLGLSNQRPAYSPITSLLPDGAELNTREVQQTYDSVPVQRGTFETNGQRPGG